MRVLVTGSTGVVGRAIVKELLYFTQGVQQIVALSRKNRYKYEDHPDKPNAMVLNCHGDLLQNPIRLITQFSPTHIFHCCGNGVVGDYFDEIWDNNVNTTYNILKACCNLIEPTRFINCSSILVNQKPLTLYNASKKAGEALVESFSDMYSDRIIGTSVRFPAVAGAGNRHGVVKATIDKLLDKEDDKLRLLTNSKKPLVYSQQLANTLVQIALYNNKASKLNLCSEESIPVSEIAKVAMQITGINKEIEWSNNSWAGDNNMVAPIFSDYKMLPVQSAVIHGINDILTEDYNGIN